MRWFLRLALASTSSLMTGKICGDQPRMTVWSLSMTCECPLRSSSSLVDRPELMMPISVATRKMPPTVAPSMPKTKTTVPASPPIVPGSSVRNIVSQSSSMKSMPCVAELFSDPDDLDDDRDDDDDKGSYARTGRGSARPCLSTCSCRRRSEAEPRVTGGSWIAPKSSRARLARWRTIRP